MLLLFAGLLLGLFLKSRRRDGRERRQRVVQYFDCTWDSQWRPMNARISNLSPTGCYIDSRFNVPAVGEPVESITVTPSAENPLVLHGTVIDSTRGIGFAVRFAELDEDTRERLRALLRSRQRG
ncbi:MAG: PilZ domain-containing protein [Vicinamibacterales bacterium]